MLAPPLRAAASVAVLPVRLLRAILPSAAPRAAAEPLDPAPAPAVGGRVGKYDAALLEIAAKRPGVTVAVAAAEIGVLASGLYPTIRRLESQGRLEKRGRGLHTT